MFIRSKGCWEDLASPHQQVRLFKGSTMFVKLILHYTEHIHIHTHMYGSTLRMSGKQKGESTILWIALASIYLGKFTRCQEPESTCLPMSRASLGTPACEVDASS
jgi:hypothetical protein